VQAAFRAASEDVIVAEISSFQLELISSFRPKVAALLNISEDHFDRYPDWEAYAGAKARLFQYQAESDTAVVNADDPASMRFSASAKSRRWEFSRNREVELGTFMKGSEVWVRTESSERPVCDTSTMKLRGNHNIENVLASAASVIAFGARIESVQTAVDRFPAPEHRLEPVAEIKGVEFLNNSMCSNVVAAVRSLEAIGRPAIVIAGGKDKGLDYGPLGEAFAKYAKHVVLIGRDAGLLESAAKSAGFDRLSRAGSMEDAVEDAWKHSQPGDTVLLSPACASFDMFKDFEDRGRVFKTAVHALAEREKN
jgi:UDP-N-acetylmuramoylalanine--D-glutamate ligase